MHVWLVSEWKGLVSVQLVFEQGYCTVCVWTQSVHVWLVSEWNGLVNVQLVFERG